MNHYIEYFWVGGFCGINPYHAILYVNLRLLDDHKMAYINKISDLTHYEVDCKKWSFDIVASRSKVLSVLSVSYLRVCSKNTINISPNQFRIDNTIRIVD